MSLIDPDANEATNVSYVISHDNDVMLYAAGQAASVQTNLNKEIGDREDADAAI